MRVPGDAAAADHADLQFSHCVHPFRFRASPVVTHIIALSCRKIKESGRFFQKKSRAFPFREDAREIFSVCVSFSLRRFSEDT